MFGKIQKKKFRVGGRVAFVRGSGWGGQGGCERRIEVFVKIQKKKLEWGVGGVGSSGVGGCRERGGGQGGCE